MLALRTHEGGFGWVGARSRLPSRSWPAAWSRLGRCSRRPGASAASADRSPCSRGRRQATPTSGRSSSPRSPADGRRDHRSRRVSCSRILARRRASRAGRATVRLRSLPSSPRGPGRWPGSALVAGRVNLVRPPRQPTARHARSAAGRRTERRHARCRRILSCSTRRQRLRRSPSRGAPRSGDFGARSHGQEAPTPLAGSGSTKGLNQ